MHELIASNIFNVFANFIGLLGNLVLMVDDYGLWIVFGMLIPFTLYILIAYKTVLNRMQ